MYKKFSIKALSIVFSVLLILVIITEIVDKMQSTNTLRDVLFTVDKTQVSALKIYPRMLNGKDILLEKQTDNWLVKYNGKSYNADTNQIKTLINTFSELKPLRYAGKDKKQQEKYELNDSLCSKVILLDKKGKELAAIRIGKFSFLQNKRMPRQNPYMQQPQGTMISYVRLENENDIFAVEGFLSLSINQEPDNFRNRKLLSINKEKINKIEFTYPADSSFVLQQNDKEWKINESIADSASVASYLYAISNLSGTNFAKQELNNATHYLKIKTTDNKTYEISAQMLDTSSVLLTSTQNIGSVFKEKPDDNFTKIFKSKNYFLK
ncbi:MAG: DUF4340 domain-containing protein [Bacteroidales bacterium]|nr:DUF4340 domain-containing protein [Bacteroidales bacterium]